MIGIAGRKGSGKDTAADMLVKDRSYHKMSFADPIKRVVKIAFRLEDGQLTGEAKEWVDDRYGISPRQMMQRVGTDLFRVAFGEDFWIKSLLDRMRSHPSNRVVVCDVRFRDELEALKGCGAKIIFLRRGHVEEEKDRHISEQGVDDLAGLSDIVIENDGTLHDLQRHLDAFLGV